jgi:NAD(P)-dependent dehydrogenase (short-subunit alcohol dehydrogenase family)
MGSGSSCSDNRARMKGQDVINECGLAGKIKNLSILVTGASSGIGIETSRVLAFNGAKVFMLGRSQTKLEEVINDVNQELKQQPQSNRGSVQGVLCDLNSLSSIKQFAQKFMRENAFLNVLILNAGIWNSRFAQTEDGLEQVMGVNHIGHAYLTQLLMPLLIASAPSRVVVVSSKAHVGPPLDYQAFDRMSKPTPNAKNGWGMISSYQQSKLANILYARALASRYQDKRVTVYSLHPGVIQTNLGSSIPLFGFAKAFMKDKTIPEGAATSVYCAVTPGLEGETGRYFDNSAVTDVADKWTNDDLNRFWNWTEKVIDEHTANL